MTHLVLWDQGLSITNLYARKLGKGADDGAA
jgi:hypothetical protein